MDSFARLIKAGVLALLLAVASLLPLKVHAYGIVPESASEPGYVASCYRVSGTSAGPWAQGQFAAEAGSNACWNGAFPNGTSRQGIWVAPGQFYSGTTCPGGTYGAVCMICTANCTIPTTFQLGPSGNVVLGCPTDSTKVDGVCLCNLGFKAVGGQCVPYVCSQPDPNGPELSWLGNTSSTCYQGCKLSAGAWGYDAASNTSYSIPSMVAVTGFCQGSGAGGAQSGSNAGTGPSANPPCPTGTCPGSVNGTQGCYPCSWNSTGPTVTASPPASSPGATPPGLNGFPNAPPGATGATTHTNCSGGNCSTTVTFTGPSGTLGSTTTDQPENDYCRQNPQALVCQDKAISGSCAAVTCNGDAIACFMAREEAKRNCEFFEPVSTGIAKAQDAAAAGDRPTWSPSVAPPEVVSVSSLVTQTDLISGACPGDMVIPLGSAPSVTIPFSKMCSALAVLGNVFVGLSILAAAFIIFKQ